MKIFFALFILLMLIWGFAGSGFSQTAQVSGKDIDRKQSPGRIHSNLNEASMRRTALGSITGKVTGIDPGHQSIQVETGTGKRSYRIDSGVRFEALRETLKGLKEGDRVRLEVARRSSGEVVTDIKR